MIQLITSFIGMTTGAYFLLERIFLGQILCVCVCIYLCIYTQVPLCLYTYGCLVVCLCGRK